MTIILTIWSKMPMPSEKPQNQTVITPLFNQVHGRERIHCHLSKALFGQHLQNLIGCWHLKLPDQSNTLDVYQPLMQRLYFWLGPKGLFWCSEAIPNDEGVKNGIIPSRVRIAKFSFTGGTCIRGALSAEKSLVTTIAHNGVDHTQWQQITHNV